MPNPEINILIKASQQGFDQVITELNKLQTAMKGVQTAVPVALFNDLAAQMTNLAKRVDEATMAMDRLAKGGKGMASRLSMEWNMKSFIGDMEKMIAVQLRWYAARALVNPMLAVMSTPVVAATMGFDFMKSVDQAEATIARYGAMEGETKAKYTATAKEIVEQSRQIALNMPIAFEEVIKVADRLRAAGIELDVVKGSLTTFAKLQITFPEIEPEKFTNAIVGFLNTFRGTPGLKDLENDTERFKVILDKVTMALSIGVIAPKDINVLIQHLGQMSQAAGFSIDQMLALSVMITNLGSKAGSAGRLLSGFLSSMGTEKFQKEMEALGYKMDRTKTVAQQFKDILVVLREQLGTGKIGGLTLGGMEQIGSMTSSERQKIVIALNREVEQYEEYLKKIEASGGALERAYGPMADTVKANLQILKNTALETALAFVTMGTDAAGANTIIKFLVDTLKVLAFTLVSVGNAVQFMAAPFVFLARTIIAVVEAFLAFREAWARAREENAKGNWAEGFRKFAESSKLAMADLRIALSEAGTKMEDSMSVSKATKRSEDAYKLLWGDPNRKTAPEAPKPPETAPDQKTPKKPDKTSAVASSRMLIGVENREYNLALQQIRNYEAEQISSYDRMRAYGIIGEEDYYRMKEGLSSDALAKTENATFVHIENLKQLYGKLYAEEAKAQAKSKRPDPGKLDAIEAQRDAEIEAANTKMDTAIRQHWVQRERDQVQSLGRQRQQLTQYTNAMLAIWKGYFHTIAAVQLAYIDMQRAAVDYSYSIGAISSAKAHDEEVRLSNEETKTKIENLNKQYAAQQKALQTEAGFKGSETQTVSVNRTIAANAAHYENELTNIKLDGEKQRLGIQLKYLKDAQWMYEAYYEGSLMKTLRHFLSIQLNEFERTGDQLKKIAESVATGMSDAFSTFFFDVYEGKVKELKDYTKQFADTVLKQAFSAISQQLTAFLLSPLKIILPGLQLPGEAMKNMQTQLMNVTAQVVNIIGKTAPPTGGGGEPGGVGPSGMTPMEAEKEQAQRDLDQVESIGPEGITYKSGYVVPEATPAYASFGETQIPTGSPMEHLEAGSAEALAQETEALSTSITDALEEGGDTFTTLLDDSFTTGSDLFTSAFDSLKGLFSGMDFGSMFGGSGGGGGGSWWGDLLGMGASMFAGEAHGGKRGGETSTGVYRLAPAAAFSGAPRFHSGKGIAQDEMAAIIKKNEWIFPADKVVQGKGGGGSSSSLTISVPLTVNGGDPDLARRLPRVIENAVRNELQKRS